MNMLFEKVFDEFLAQAPMRAALERLRAGRGAWLSGVWGAGRAFTAAAMLRDLRQPTAIFCMDEDSALELYEELRFFMQGFPSLADPGQASEFTVKYPTLLDPGKDPLVYFPALEFGSVDSVNREHGKSIERLLILRRLAAGEPLVLVSTLQALLQKLPSPEAVLGASLSLKKGGSYAREELVGSLLRLGYRREASVEEPGQFNIRGGIVDVAPPDMDYPWRLEFDGDLLESLRSFDPASQKSLASGEQLDLMPFQELILDEAGREEGINRLQKLPLKKEILAHWVQEIREQRSLGQNWLLPLFFPETSLCDYLKCLDSKPLIVLDQPHQWSDAATSLLEAMEDVSERRKEQGLPFPQAAQMLTEIPAIFKNLRAYPCLGFSLLGHSFHELGDLQGGGLTFKSLNLSPGDTGMLMNEVLLWTSQGRRVLVACHSQGELMRFKDLCDEKKLVSRPLASAQDWESLNEGELGLMLAKIERGFASSEAKLVLVSDQEIFRRNTLKTPRVYRHRYKGLKSRKIESFSELKEGQAAVHVKHGIGIFRGMARLNIEGFDKDFVCLEYAEREKLYVPVDQVNLVQKYLGGDENPKLHKLGGYAWAAAQEKVKKSVAELAAELLKIYASRQVASSAGTGPDSKWQKEFEASFPFEETEDQLRAIEEIKRDMESKKPMDRLLCGDVGFGKTEVALRACFKTVMSGQQAAILVPTTVLCQQHFTNFSERLQDFPVKIGMLSRFRTQKEQKAVVEGLKEGTIDLVVGTHRLLSQDIVFKRLGLIVVDEEQRFGVAHKERLKKLKTQVGVLAMSATPVPRTLHFSLSGLRDMSLIETAPLDRLPVRTYVLEDNQEIMREALLQELSRKGQVFFVHNRVKDIEKVAERLRTLIPEASIAVAHGQMPKDELERVMVEFFGRAHDILVATTIIESGLDIPNVNTIIINHAEDFGLSQLYQLRGRVGRSERQGYAYLFYPRSRSLPEVAEKRLAAIEEFTELGSGFKVAMRDLEIRGVGNILGPQQHGHVAAVGFDLYCHLLNEAVANLKGEEIQPDRTPALQLDLEAYLPENFIDDPRQKMEWYKRLAAIETREQLHEAEAELKDRYGEIPRQASNLLEVVEIRLWALDLGLAEITQKSSQIAFRYFEDCMPPESFVSEMMLRFKDKIRFLAGPPPGFVLQTAAGQSGQVLKSLLPQMKRHVKVTARS
jgi:transcription-repair coupling factor (superfamily II helicase)